MMSCAASEVWSRSVLSHYCTKHGQRCGVALSGDITIVAISKSGQLGRRCTVAACPHVLWAMMTQVSGVLVTYEHTLKTCEPSHIGRPAKPFFILEVCGQQRAVRHVAVLGPLEQGGGVQCRGTCGSDGALLSGKAGSGVTGHVVAPEPS
jgi:hypothetical protein